MTGNATLFSDGAAYERSMGRWSQRAGAVFLDWLDAPRDQDWLDVGCGNGAFTETIITRQKPSSISAIDPSQAQVDYARKRPACADAQFRTGDAQSLPYDDNSFDNAVMALVISFIPDPDKAIAELARVTRPGGIVAAYMWDTAGDGHPANPINTAMRAMGLSGPGAPHHDPARLERLQDIWHGAHLQAVETRVITIPVTYASFEDFWDSNRISTGPLGRRLASLSPEQGNALQAALRETLPQNSSGAITYQAHANAVKGRTPFH
jgi:SAM-dependent methyltransferase